MKLPSEGLRSSVFPLSVLSSTSSSHRRTLARRRHGRTAGRPATCFRWPTRPSHLTLIPSVLSPPSCSLGIGNGSTSTCDPVYVYVGPKRAIVGPTRDQLICATRRTPDTPRRAQCAAILEIVPGLRVPSWPFGVAGGGGDGAMPMAADVAGCLTHALPTNYKTLLRGAAF